jgi:hypothetical protein
LPEKEFFKTPEDPFLPNEISPLLYFLRPGGKAPFFGESHLGKLSGLALTRGRIGLAQSQEGKIHLDDLL